MEIAIGVCASEQAKLTVAVRRRRVVNWQKLDTAATADYTGDHPTLELRFDR